MVMEMVPEITRIIEEIPGRVRDCRVKANLSQVKLGKEIGVSQTIIQRIESGNADLDVERAFLIAYVTGQRVSYIMGQTNELIQNPILEHLDFRQGDTGDGDWCSGNTGDSGEPSLDCAACVKCETCEKQCPVELRGLDKKCQSPTNGLKSPAVEASTLLQNRA